MSSSREKRAMRAASLRESSGERNAIGRLGYGMLALDGTLERLLVFRKSLEQADAFGREDFSRRPLRDHTAVFQTNHFGIQLQRLIHIMCDGKHWNLARCEPDLHFGKKLIAECTV